ncbi:MAG: hypothetical protein SVT52_03615 [Planctomycetota bacterium]|nr:hypothetical protein [Planctomycetota bacterium]
MKHRRKYRNRRGSVLLMVVGLLTILAMLGGTLLIISHMDAKTSDALSAKSQADPIAEGIVSQVQALLKEDLYIDATNGPYGNYDGSTSQENWRKFIDHPAYESGGLEVEIDHWLASGWYSGITTWAHVSNISGENLNDVNNVTVGAPDNDYADADGDGDRDARFFDTGVTNNEGETYYAAVRVIDLAGLLCVNTGAQSDAATMPDTTRPVSIELSSFLSGCYSNLHDERCGGTGTTDLEDFSENAAECLLAPSGDYLPFAIGDEMYLRWLTADAPTETGRLYDEITSLATDKRRQLTTFTCSRSLVRRPTGTFTEPLVLTGSTINEIRDRVVYMLAQLSIGADDNARQHIAAAFVANLWAYQSNGTTGFPWAFNYTVGATSYTAYGVVPQPVITESYARFVQSSQPDPGPHDHKWFAAIEIYNPGSLPAGLTYKLADTVISVPVSGQRNIYYDYEGYGNLAAIAADTGIDQATLNDGIRINGLQFYEGKTVKLTCTKLASPEIVIDEVSSADLNHSAASPTDSSETDDIRRDDATNRARYNIAAYLHTDDSGGVQQELGESNNLTESTTLSPDADYSAPIIRKEGEISDLGELLHIYCAGHFSDGSDEIPFTKRLLNSSISAIFDDNPARGRLDPHPDDVAYDRPTGYTFTDYPDVPAAAMLSEFFTLVPPDGTRTDITPDSRIYGRININTATEDVLERLPFETNITLSGYTNPVITVSDVVDYIIAYRDMTQHGTSRNYASRSDPAGADITNLRSNDPNSNIDGFLTAGEVAIPLADYVTDRILAANGGLTLDDLKKLAPYLEARDALYRSISNLITVNSDVYAANIVVQLRDSDGNTRYTWNYIAVLDRSNCDDTGDQPAVLLFSEIK